MEEQEPSEKFVTGFNAGYQLGKHEPELLIKILKSNNDQNEFVKALNFGNKQYQKEQFIQQHNSAVEKQKEQYKPKSS